MNHLIASLSLLAVGCAGLDVYDDQSEPSEIELANDVGKSDAVGVAVDMTDDGPSAKLFFFCRSADGCRGTLQFSLDDPHICHVFPERPLCFNQNPGPGETFKRAVASVELRDNSNFLDHTLFTVGREQGDNVSSQSMMFETAGGHEFSRFDILLRKEPGVPNVTVGVFAFWEEKQAPSECEDGNCEPTPTN